MAIGKVVGSVVHLSQEPWTSAAIDGPPNLVMDSATMLRGSGTWFAIAPDKFATSFDTVLADAGITFPSRFTAGSGGDRSSVA